MQVRATRVNPYTLLVDAPAYFPPERVWLIARHITHEGCHSLGRLPFEFLSRDAVLARVLQDTTVCPVTFMCESLGISPADIKSLDSALAVTFRGNMPRGFNLIGLHNNNLQERPSSSLYPTVLHFAAAFGLYHLTTDCLLDCPGAKEASLQRNCHGRTPKEIAQEGGFDELAERILSFEARCGDEIYEQMENSQYDVPPCPEDPGYTEMRPGYINIQLWGPEGEEENDGYVESDQQQEFQQTEEEQEFYEDMSKGIDDSTDGYYDNCPGQAVSEPALEGEEGQELYTDMSEDFDPHYADVPENPPVEGELYEDLSGGESPLADSAEPANKKDSNMPPSHALYDTPSNIPAIGVGGRSVSTSVRMPARHSRDPASLAKGHAAPEIPPAVPKRASIPVVTSHNILHRTSSTGSRISSSSASSGSSAASAGSEGYKADGDNFPDETEDIMVTREELLKGIGKTKFPPPLPPADYSRPSTASSPPPVSPRGTGSLPSTSRTKHARSRTGPVSMVDLMQSVDTVKQPRPSSFKGSERPSPRRTVSEQQIKGIMPPTPSRRDAEKTRSCIDRPPVPTPDECQITRTPPRDRPPAPVPRESDVNRRGSLGQIPTPFTVALTGPAKPRVPEKDEAEAASPPPPPHRAAPRGVPTPAPRSRAAPPLPRR